MIQNPKILRALRFLWSRLAVAALACFMGLTVSWSWKSLIRPHVIGVQLAETPTEPQVQITAEPQRMHSPGAAGNGITKGGVPFSFTSFTSSDGVAYFQWSETHRSPGAAHRTLAQALSRSIKIIKRESLLDETGRRVGERIVATFPARSRYGSAAVLWTEGSTFGYVSAPSLENLLDSEKN